MLLDIPGSAPLNKHTSSHAVYTCSIHMHMLQTRADISPVVPQVFGELHGRFFFAELERVHGGGQQLLQLHAMQLRQREDFAVR